MARTRIGLFGGTFDPPHLGHLILAGEAVAQLELNRLLWMLAPTPPHKLDQHLTALEQRLAMVERAVAGDPAFELSRLELERPGPHYTLDTVLQLREADPQADVVLVIGGDSLLNLTDWHRPAELIAACHALGVMLRPAVSHDLPSKSRAAVASGTNGELVEGRRPELVEGRHAADLDELEAALPGIRAKIRFIEAPLLEIASSDIRQRVAHGQPFRYYLPPSVYEYILQHGLYKNSR